MAKKNTYTPSMAGDANLIAGAQLVSQGFVGGAGGDAVMSAGAASANAAQARNAQRRAINAAADTRMADFMEGMPLGVDIEKIPTSMRNSMVDFASTKKEEYFRAAQVAANAGPNTQHYADAVVTMNKITQQFKNLNNDLTKLYETKIKTIDDFDANSISMSTDPNAKDFMSRLTTDEVVLGINPESGRLAIGDDGAMTMDNLPKMYYKDHGVAKEFVDLNSTLYTEGQPLDEGRATIVRMQIQGMLDKGGPNAVRSLAMDDHIVPGGLGIDVDLYSPQELKQVVSDQLFNLLQQSAQGGYQAQIDKENRADQRAIDRSKQMASNKRNNANGGKTSGKTYIQTESGNIEISEQNINRAQGAMNFVNNIYNGDISDLSSIEYDGQRILQAKTVTAAHVQKYGEDDELLAANVGKVRLILSNDDVVYIDPNNPNDMKYLAKQYLAQYGMNDDTREILDIINQMDFMEPTAMPVEDDPYFMGTGLPAPGDNTMGVRPGSTVQGPPRPVGGGYVIK